MRKNVSKNIFVRKNAGIKCFIVFILFFISVTTQNLLAQTDKKITINLKDVSVKTALDELQKKTGLHFMYDEEIIAPSKKITLNYEEAQLSAILNDFCNQTSLQYEVRMNLILFYKKRDEQEAKKAIDMVTITGTVQDDNKNPLVGTAVYLEDTNFGTFTNLEGKYELQIPKEISYKAQIVFSLMTYEKLEISYDKQTVINAILKENKNLLNEVVVTGYQVIDKRKVVGAITTLNMDSIIIPSYSSVDQMLQGQVAGMIVTQSSTRAGTSPKISIRGTSTLMGNTEPLWVIDGITVNDVPSLNGHSNLIGSDESGILNDFIGNQISWLNPNDIETINILKDASATAIYGSRASNGVIVITTKRGNRERVSINYSTNLSVRPRPTYSDYNVMNSQERVNFSKEAFDAGVYYNVLPLMQPHTYEGATMMYLNGMYNEDEYIKQYNYLETVNTDWLKLLTRTTFSHNHNLSVNGGSEKAIYSASVSYNNTQGIEKGNDSERYSGRLRLGLDISPTLKLDANMTGTVVKTDGFTNTINPLSYALSTTRALPAYDQQGNPIFYKRDGKYMLNPATDNNLTFNALNELNNSFSKIKTPQLNANITLRWDVLPVLNYEFVAGYQKSDRTSNAFAGDDTFYIIRNYRGYERGTVTATDPEFKAAQLPFGGELVTENTSAQSYNVQNKVTFTKNFNQDNRLSAFAAVEIRSVSTKGKYNTIYGYLHGRGEGLAQPTPLDEIVPMGGASIPTGWGILGDIYSGRWRSTNRRDNFFSAFGSIAYTFKNRYDLYANLRHDASNRFGQDVNNRFDPTFSVGVAWIASDETFFKDNLKGYIDFLKLRLTYGSQGNVLTNQGPEMLIEKSRPSSVYGEYYNKLSRLENQLLGWERTYSWNAGLDFTLFNNKISATFDYYYRKSDPMSSERLPYEYGTNNKVPLMGAQIDNSGLEGTINITALRTKDWNITGSINLSKNWNKVKKIANRTNQNINTSSYLSGQTKEIYEINYPVSAFWAYSFNGLDPETGYPTFNYLDGSNGENYTDFLVYAGTRDPSMTGGVNLNIRYKSIGLTSQFAAVLGGKTFLSNPYANFVSGRMPREFTNLPKELINRWKKPGDELYTDIPSVFIDGAYMLNIKDPSGYESNNIYTAWASSDTRLVSKSFLRCRNISLNWYVPKNILKHIKAQNLTLSASATNLFVLASSKYKGFDPELQTEKMPVTFSFGLNVTF